MTKLFIIRNWLYIGVTLILSILSFCLGSYVQDSKKSDKLVVDFKTKGGELIEYKLNFISPVGLHYLYINESKKSQNYKAYFDTLRYFRRNLVYFNVSDTNYLLIFKPDSTSNLEDVIYGFTKNKFFIYEPKEIILKNFPSSSMRRAGENLRPYSYPHESE